MAASRSSRASASRLEVVAAQRRREVEAARELLRSLDDPGEGADQDVAHAAALERFQRRVRVEALAGSLGRRRSSLRAF